SSHLYSPSLLRCRSPPPLLFFFSCSVAPRALHSFPTRRSSDLPEVDQPALQHVERQERGGVAEMRRVVRRDPARVHQDVGAGFRSEEHTSELQSRENLVCRLLLEKKNTPMQSLINHQPLPVRSR